MQEINETKEQANVTKSIDTNVSGTMPNGDPAPKRDPNDGGNKTKIAIGSSAIGTGGAAVESVTEGAQPEVVPQQPLNQPEIKPQRTQQNNSWWQSFLDLFQ